MQGLRIAAATLLVCFGQAPSFATDRADRVERLAALGKLWATAKYFHPYLAYRDIDLDAALVNAIPRAGSVAGFPEAVQFLLDVLEDPITRIVNDREQPPPGPGGVDSRLEDGILIVTFRDSPSLNGLASGLRRAGEHLPRARAAVFDARSSRLFPYALAQSGLDRMLSSTRVSGPGHRTRMHSGLTSPDAGAFTIYNSAFVAYDAPSFEPETGARDLSVVFLLNERSAMPAIALALQAAGKAAIIAEGALSDDALVPFARVELPHGIEVQVRTGELVYLDGTGGIEADAVVPPNQGFEAAIASANNPRPQAPRARRRLPAVAARTPAETYAGTPYPGPEYRLLAAFRIWSVFHYFFPYKDLMGEDWDARLKEFITRMEAARDAREYHLAVAEMVAHVHDSHASVSSPVLAEFFGRAAPPVRLRWIESAPVVTDLLDEHEAGLAGIRVGDVILKVDGDDAGRRIDRLRKYISASTPQALMAAVTFALLNGPDGSTVSLTARGSDGSITEIAMTRRERFRGLEPEKFGEIVRLLSDDIGYADLTRLSRSMVDSMFERLKHTRAIIFDMRGYPQGTAWVIAPRLTDKERAPVARFERPLVMFPENQLDLAGQAASYTFSQTLLATEKWRYKGETVMLIDERAISQAEHTGLFFEAANGTKFIGSPSTGANGDVTHFYVPGGIRIGMTGHGVRHANGRQLQRIGLVPDIEARPTIGGIRAGRDEVLERALEYLQTGR